MTDPDFHGGHYYEKGVVPRRGLRIARMIGHITYLSDDAMMEKFGRVLRRKCSAGLRLRHRLRDRVLPAPPGRQVRELLRRQHLPAHHQGARLLRPGAPTTAATCRRRFARAQADFLVVSFTSDWRFSSGALARDRASALLDNRRDRVLPRDRRAAGPRRLPARRCALPSARCAPTSATSRYDPIQTWSRSSRWVAPGARVLDLGCGDGTLLKHLWQAKRRRPATASRSTTPRCSRACATTSTCCRWIWRTASPRSATAPSTA